MGIGFIITIIFFAALLGIFSRQVLATNEDSRYTEDDHNGHDDHTDNPHFHAM